MRKYIFCLILFGFSLSSFLVYAQVAPDIMGVVTKKSLDKCDQWSSLESYLHDLPSFEIRNWINTLNGFAKDDCKGFDQMTDWVLRSNDRLLSDLRFENILVEAIDQRTIRSRIEFLRSLKSLVSFPNVQFSTGITKRYNAKKNEFIRESSSSEEPVVDNEKGKGKSKGKEKQTKVRAKLTPLQNYQAFQEALIETMAEDITPDMFEGGLNSAEVEELKARELKKIALNIQFKGNSIEEKYSDFNLQKTISSFQTVLFDELADVLFPSMYLSANSRIAALNLFKNPDFLNYLRQSQWTHLKENPSLLGRTFIVHCVLPYSPLTFASEMEERESQDRTVFMIQSMAKSKMVQWSGGQSALIYHAVKHKSRPSKKDKNSKNSGFRSIFDADPQAYYQSAMAVITKATEVIFREPRESVPGSKLIGSFLFCKETPGKEKKVSRSIVHILDMSGTKIPGIKGVRAGMTPSLVTFQDDLDSCE
jgi:hypothetical protein